VTAGAGRILANVLPKEASDGLMRVWPEILRERHPGVEWVDARSVAPNEMCTAAAPAPDEGNEDRVHSPRRLSLFSPETHGPSARKVQRACSDIQPHAGPMQGHGSDDRSARITANGAHVSASESHGHRAVCVSDVTVDGRPLGGSAGGHSSAPAAMRSLADVASPW
jgi:hypothetical protein